MKSQLQLMSAVRNIRTEETGHIMEMWPTSVLVVLDNGEYAVWPRENAWLREDI